MFFFKNKDKIFFFLLIYTVIIFIVSADNQSMFEENVKCEKIQRSEFPKDLFSDTQRKYGAIILHVIFAIYCFGAITLVCRERFLPTMNCLCLDLKLSDDVAAATFMSIATSAPELFSNIIGTFITESDIGIGHVIGNGYYNMFFVAAIGGLAASQEVILDWWPLARDCGIYALVSLVLTGIVWDSFVQTYETVVLLLLYFIYFIIMFNNKKIVNVITQKFNIEIINDSQNEGIEFKKRSDKVKNNVEEKKDIEESESLEYEQNFTLPSPIVYRNSKAENERWNVAKKIITMPITFLIRYTIPDIRVNKYRKYYPAAFVICVAWIGVSTYLGTWMISVLGETIGVPDLVMGMVFMAAGGSVVEAYSVYHKAKRGECSIGMSNSLGCNNLDITLCLALPWLIKTLPIPYFFCENDFSKVKLESSLIHINCLLLVISVIALYIIFYLNKFKLNKKLGLVCGGTYIIVLFIGISLENFSKRE